MTPNLNICDGNFGNCYSSLSAAMNIKLKFNNNKKKGTNNEE